MKISYLLTLGIALGAYSQINLAGEIADTYTTGDTLTATKLNKIKSAVNDNHSRGVNNAIELRHRFSGDGSAGDLTISTDVDWSITPPANPNFDNIRIEAGQTLTVPAGTTIRCRGDFVNLGTLKVLPGAKMAGHNSIAFGATPDLYSIGHPGDTFRPASGGAYNNDSLNPPVTVQGGTGGEGIPKATATTSFNSFRIGGGSGTGMLLGGNEGAGGGLVKIYSGSLINNSGEIDASGEPGSQLPFGNGGFGGGGGGGGIVIMAATMAIIDNNLVATIDVSGGQGGRANIYGGPGGGGGGGIVILIAPVFTLNSAPNVSGGSPGSTNFVIENNLIRTGGGAGGGSGGNGGDGSDIPGLLSTFPGLADPGTDGYVIQIERDPRTMMY